MPFIAPKADISVRDAFFSPRIETSRRVTIPYMWETLHDRVPGVAPSGCIRNFEIAAGLAKGGFTGFWFQDSDLWKWIEGVSYSLAHHPDAALEKQVDEAMALAGKAQQPDGYLDTYYIIKEPPEKRFTNLKDNHELYVAGHMFEAACAYYLATGKDALLKIACRFADCICRHFGPGEAQSKGYPGHEEAEMGLARLYGVTGKREYLDTALFFLDQRGTKPYYFDTERLRSEGALHNRPGDQWDDYTYYQADVPVREQTVARGHAVRQGYLLAGMAEAGYLAGDESLLTAAERVFDNIVNRQMYVTGGVGATHVGEAFTLDWDLPPERCYTETCASIALIMAAKRLHQAHPHGKYGDTVERALYNGILSGISLDGTKYFYMNPLEVWPERCEKRQDMNVDAERKGWFGCACCPPNVLRTLTGLGKYLYTRQENALYIDQYVASDYRDDAWAVSLSSLFPWQGNGALTVAHAPEGSNALCFRLPGWAGEYAMTLNGETIDVQPKDGYLCIERVWQAGDEVKFSFPMAPRALHADTRVPNYAGKIAFRRGPIVYCAEEADNGKQLWNLSVNPGTVSERFEPSLLGGVMALRCKGQRESGENGLYSFSAPQSTDAEITLIPYYAWNNRGKGEMTVWLRESKS